MLPAWSALQTALFSLSNTANVPSVTHHRRERGAASSMLLSGTNYVSPVMLRMSIPGTGEKVWTSPHLQTLTTAAKLEEKLMRRRMFSHSRAGEYKTRVFTQEDCQSAHTSAPFTEIHRRRENTGSILRSPAFKSL